MLNILDPMSIGVTLCYLLGFLRLVFFGTGEIWSLCHLVKSPSSYVPVSIEMGVKGVKVLVRERFESVGWHIFYTW